MKEPSSRQRAFTISGPTQKKVALSRKAWDQTEAIKPKHVKVTKCPGFTGVSRYDPDAKLEGEFMSDWKRLRSKA